MIGLINREKIYLAFVSISWISFSLEYVRLQFWRHNFRRPVLIKDRLLNLKGDKSLVLSRSRGTNGNYSKKACITLVLILVISRSPNGSRQHTSCLTTRVWSQWILLTRCFTCKCPHVERCVTVYSLFSTSHVHPFSVWFHCATIFIDCSLVGFSHCPILEMFKSWPIYPFKWIRWIVMVGKAYPLFLVVRR